MTVVRVLHPADYRRVRWKNDGGWTTELAAGRSTSPGAEHAFDWRVSIADIESDGAFSAFPGCDRRIALLEGIGMLLSFDQAPDQELRERLRFVSFAGDWQANGRLLSGPVRDFNVIWRRDAVSAEVLHRPLVGPMVFFADPAVTWFAYLTAGTASLKNRGKVPPLQAGDSLLLEPDDGSASTVLNGGGELVLVKFTARATSP